MKKKLARLVRIRNRQRDLAAATHNAVLRALGDAEARRDEAIAQVQALTSGRVVSARELEHMGLATIMAGNDVRAAKRRAQDTQRGLMEAASALHRSQKLHERAEVAERIDFSRRENRDLDDIGGRKGR